MFVRMRRTAAATHAQPPGPDHDPGPIAGAKLKAAALPGPRLDLTTLTPF